jgi:hypothetical protein
MVGGLHGVTLLHSMGRAGVEERSYSNGVEWSGVISGHSMELLKEMSLSLMGHGDIPFRKAVSYC